MVSVREAVTEALAPGDDDSRWMREALELAGQGVGLASPNPTVGCVLVKDGRAVGRGFHEYDKRDHAEVVALKQAGAEAARGATAYVTLEPCSHYGRTPPCARALVEAGVSRVVAATVDANPAVHGEGMAQLAGAGIAVRAGVCEAEARALNYGFARFIRTRLPFVTLKTAATLDGRIADGLQQRGRPLAITGPEARAEVQRLRHEADALLTGVGTVLADDPLLTDRSGRARRRPLVRVVLDARLRLPVQSRLVEAGSVVVVTRSEDAGRRRELEARGVRVHTVAAQAEGGLSLGPVLQWLGEQNMLNVLIEAGARVNRSALLSDAVDRALLFYAPFFLGAEGVPLLAGGEARWPRLRSFSLRRFGQDFAVDSLLRDPWE
jgi:diaminohydroxyphosphoribosylaminopyrimidine deaminase/5-amino-6-(5-phosphoribosylamino)uracil reductase